MENSQSLYLAAKIADRIPLKIERILFWAGYFLAFLPSPDETRKLLHAMIDCSTFDHDWTFEEIRHEINRLKSILRNPNATKEECAIARDQLAFYQSENDFDERIGG